MNDIEPRPYRMEDALQLLTDPNDIAWAKLNEVAGTGKTFVKDGKVLGCGGVRNCGVGEAWAIISPDAKGMKKELLRLTRDNFEEMIKTLNLWQVFATTKDISPQQANFLEHLGFEKSECYVYVRK